MNSLLKICVAPGLQEMMPQSAMLAFLGLTDENFDFSYPHFT